MNNPGVLSLHWSVLCGENVLYRKRCKPLPTYQMPWANSTPGQVWYIKMGLRVPRLFGAMAKSHPGEEHWFILTASCVHGDSGQTVHWHYHYTLFPLPTYFSATIPMRGPGTGRLEISLVSLANPHSSSTNLLYAPIYSFLLCTIHHWTVIPITCLIISINFP